jgi:glucose/arabinose dehydrogenase
MSNRCQLPLSVGCLVAAVALLGGASPAAAQQAKLELQKGDHVCIIGNTLAERMQHDGWLEALIQARFPSHELVFRNLGYSGDEVHPERRLRSANFGSLNEWLAGVSPPPHKFPGVAENRFALTNTKADVIFAFFGYNESWAGEAGLGAFRNDLTAFLKDVAGQKYNGKSAPRVVLFSPTAFDNTGHPNLPDGAVQNKNLKLYSDAMAEVAEANGALFVDLFGPTHERWQKPHEKRLARTINGVHLTSLGNLIVASVAYQSLFGAEPPTGSSQLEALEPLRKAVLDKNWHWYHRYRTTDGYSNFGGRGSLTFTDGQSNYEVLQRESEILDVMTSNRDKAVWAAAQGEQVKIDDSNTPPFLPVKTNKPGPGPDGKHVFLSGEEAIKHMKTGPNLKVSLFASEEQFPELVEPVQMAFDTKGRLWVAAWATYPHFIPKQPMNDKLLILEDTNNDGKADVCKTFAGDIHNPTGFEFYNGGVIVASGPEILFLKDTDGDDKYDVRERVIHGVDTADTHHASNSFTFDPGGALYFQEGTFHRSQIESPHGPAVRLADAGVFRYRPVTQEIDVYVSYGFANPHGHVFDRWGQDFVTDGTGAETFWAPTFSGRVYFPQKHGKPPKPYEQRTRPCSATEILSSRHFPDDVQGNLLVLNVIGFQGILQYKFADKDSGFAATEIEPLVQSDDPNFRPADIEVAPDGSVYFTDWHNPIIGHMQHNLRDPNRDRDHGRVYRITYEGRELAKPAKIDGQAVEALLDLLKDSQDRVRYQAKIELSERKGEEVVAAAKKWVAGLDKNDKDYEHHRLEGLWVQQWHNAVDADLLKQVLRSPDPRARAAATRVLADWRDRMPDALALLKVQATDEHPRVRLEAVRACSFFQTPEAAEVALESLNFPQDPALEHTLNETIKTLERFQK